MTDFYKGIQLGSRVPNRVPKFNTQFATMIGQQTRFIASRALLSKIKGEFFKVGELDIGVNLKDNENIKDNYFNVPVYDYLAFMGGEYTNIEGKTKSYGGGIGSVFVITPVILEVSQSKNIVKTDIQGRDGTIKEFISNGDLMFTARGMIVSDTNEYPQLEVDTLATILKANTNIEIESLFMQTFLEKDYSIVIESYNISQQRGKRNTQPFEIVMSSDTIVELREEEAKR